MRIRSNANVKFLGNPSQSQSSIGAELKFKANQIRRGPLKGQELPRVLALAVYSTYVYNYRLLVRNDSARLHGDQTCRSTCKIQLYLYNQLFH